jgi:hypothetical protein
VNQNLTRALVGTGFGFGAAAVVAPRALGRAYGIAGSGETDGLMRLYGTRTAALGALAATAGSDETLRTVVKTVAAVSAVDTLCAAIMGVRGSTSSRTAAQTAITTAAVTGMCLLALRD